MIPKEQIAHELTMVYMKNRYGVSIDGDFSSGSGTVKSEHFPSAKKIKYILEKTGEKGLFFDKTKKVESGYEVDEVFAEMIEEYYQAYSKFLHLLDKSEYF